MWTLITVTEVQTVTAVTHCTESRKDQMSFTFLMSYYFRVAYTLFWISPVTCHVSRQNTQPRLLDNSLLHDLYPWKESGIFQKLSWSAINFHHLLYTKSVTPFSAFVYRKKDNIILSQEVKLPIVWKTSNGDQVQG